MLKHNLLAAISTVAEAPPPTVPPWLIWAVILVISTCLIAWGVVATRWQRGLPILPRQPRRPVPWTGFHLLLVAAVYVGGVTAAALLAHWILPAHLTRTPSIQNADASNAAHMVARLLHSGDWRVLLVCGLSVVVVAPIVEEFFFRVLLQGWLESGQRRLQPRMPTLGRWVPGGLGPILITAFLFARLHFRVDTPLSGTSFLILMLAADAAAKLVAMTFAVVLLRSGFSATPADLGWVREKFFADLGLGLFTFAAVAAPIYGMQFALVALLPSYLAPDPFVLFFFALVLGTLVYRTHRIVPAIVLHMSLNVTSFAMALMLTHK